MPDRINLKIRTEDGGFWATVDEFSGVFATVATVEELRASLAKGNALYVAERGKCLRRVHSRRSN